jgi:sugar lactone lactonase YvrE
MSVSVELVLDVKAALGECPVWSADERVLYWIDIPRGRLNRLDPATGRNTFWVLPAPVGSFALRAAGGFLVALKTGFHLFDPASGAVKLVAHPEPHMHENRLNDGRADRAGRFWAGTMKDPIEPHRAQAQLYRLDPDGHVTPMQSGIITSNGLAISPDDKTLYFSDSHPTIRTIWAYDLDIAAGEITGRRIFVDTMGMRGRPDGGCCDADGCYWMAANDGGCLIRLTPKGKIDRTIELPVKKPTMPAFGGPDLDTIFVTSIRPEGADLSDQPLAGGIFAVRCGVKGLPEPKFAG